MKTYAGMTAEERRAQRRARLIASARELFGTQGYADTSIRAVLRKSGLQDRYFSESFSGTDELLAAVYVEIEAEVFSDTMKGIDPAAKPSQRMRRILENLARALRADPIAARVKLVETVGVSPVIEQRRREALHAYTDAVAVLLPAPSPGRGLDRKVLAQAFVSGINGMLTDWLTGSLDINSDQLVDHGIVLFCGLERELLARTAAEI